MAPLPLTQTQRDELDQAIRDDIPALDQHILSQDSKTADTDTDFDKMFSEFLAVTHVQTILLFNRNNLNNVLDPTKFTRASLKQHPQLCKTIRNVCQTGSYSRILDQKMMQISDTSSARFS